MNHFRSSNNRMVNEKSDFFQKSADKLPSHLGRAGGDFRAARA